MQGLQGGSGHRQQRRRAQLERQHPCSEIEPRSDGADRGQGAEGFGAGDLGGPERAVAELFRSPSYLHSDRQSEVHEWRECDSRRHRVTLMRRVVVVVAAVSTLIMGCGDEPVRTTTLRVLAASSLT